MLDNNSNSAISHDDLSTSASHLFPNITGEQYNKLLRMARALHRRCPSKTLTPYSLIHEAVIKLLSWHRPDTVTDEHFMRVAARAMRQLLVDDLRKNMSAKRGAGIQFVTLTERSARTHLTPVEFLDMNRALDKLAEMNHRHVLVFELTAYFGYTLEDTAEILKVSPRTIQRDLRAVNAWLASQIGNGGSSEQ